MHSSDLWNENDLLRKKLHDTQSELERERAERLKLKAENLWLKKLVQEKALARSPEELADRLVEKLGADLEGPARLTPSPLRAVPNPQKDHG